MNWIGYTFVLFAGCAMFTACSHLNDSSHSNSEYVAIPSPETTPRLLTDQELARRNEVEKLMLEGKYLHDGPSELREIGDINSVPALLVVLRENPPHKDGLMICTTAHGLSALRKLTGANPGITYEAWSVWWEKYKRDNPASGR